MSTRRQRTDLERERSNFLLHESRIIRERDEILKNIRNHLDELDAEIVRLGGRARGELGDDLGGDVFGDLGGDSGDIAGGNDGGKGGVTEGVVDQEQENGNDPTTNFNNDGSSGFGAKNFSVGSKISSNGNEFSTSIAPFPTVKKRRGRPPSSKTKMPKPQKMGAKPPKSPRPPKIFHPLSSSSSADPNQLIIPPMNKKRGRPRKNSVFVSADSAVSGVPPAVPKHVLVLEKSSTDISTAAAVGDSGALLAAVDGARAVSAVDAAVGVAGVVGAVVGAVDAVSGGMKGVPNSMHSTAGATKHSISKKTKNKNSMENGKKKRGRPRKTSLLGTAAAAGASPMPPMPPVPFLSCSADDFQPSMTISMSKSIDENETISDLVAKKSKNIGLQGQGGQECREGSSPFSAFKEFNSASTSMSGKGGESSNSIEHDETGKSLQSVESDDKKPKKKSKWEESCSSVDSIDSADVSESALESEVTSVSSRADSDSTFHVLGFETMELPKGERKEKNKRKGGRRASKGKANCSASLFSPVSTISIPANASCAASAFAASASAAISSKSPKGKKASGSTPRTSNLTNENVNKLEMTVSSKSGKQSKKKRERPCTPNGKEKDGSVSSPAASSAAIFAASSISNSDHGKKAKSDKNDKSAKGEKSLKKKESSLKKDKEINSAKRSNGSMKKVPNTEKVILVPKARDIYRESYDSSNSTSGNSIQSAKSCLSGSALEQSVSFDSTGGTESAENVTESQSRSDVEFTIRMNDETKARGRQKRESVISDKSINSSMAKKESKTGDKKINREKQKTSEKKDGNVGIVHSESGSAKEDGQGTYQPKNSSLRSFAIRPLSRKNDQDSLVQTQLDEEKKDDDLENLVHRERHEHHEEESQAGEEQIQNESLQGKLDGNCNADDL